MTSWRLQGYLLALASVLLTTLAQLAMKWGMSHLLWPMPGQGAGQDLLAYWQLADGRALCLVAAGIVAYLLSMGCWVMALGRLPLGKAYPLLGLSYVLVVLACAWLPGMEEPLTAARLAGVGLIGLGVWLVVAPARK